MRTDTWGASGAPSRFAWLGRLSRQLPVFWKIQIANTAFLLAATWAGAWAGARARGPGVLSASLGGTAALLAVACTAVLLRVALRPLERVVATMTAVGQGDERARAHEDGDPWAFALARTLNAMLDRLTAQKRAAALAAMRAEDEERGRIARELHDDPCQRLARLTASLQDHPELAREALDVLEGLRRSMAALHPAVLEDLGFAAALRWLGEEAGGAGPETDALPVVHVEAHAGPPPGRDVQHAAFRIAQEAVTNARRHAAARSVWVRWDRTEGGWELQVEDDGRGMDRVAPPPERGAGDAEARAAGEAARYGLRAMRARAAAIGGALRWEAAPGGGTVVTLSCPDPAAGGGEAAEGVPSPDRADGAAAVEVGAPAPRSAPGGDAP